MYGTVASALDYLVGRQIRRGERRGNPLRLFAFICRDCSDNRYSVCIRAFTADVAKYTYLLFMCDQDPQVFLDMIEDIGNECSSLTRSGVSEAFALFVPDHVSIEELNHCILTQPSFLHAVQTPRAQPTLEPTGGI